MFPTKQSETDSLGRCRTMLNLMWLKNAGRSCKMKDLIPPTAPPPSSPGYLGDIMFQTIRLCHQVAPQTVSSLMPWSRSERRSLRTPSVVSLGACPWQCQTCVQAHAGHINYWVSFWVATMPFCQTRPVNCIIFSLIIGVSLISTLYRLIFFLLSIKLSGIFQWLIHHHRCMYIVSEWVAKHAGSGKNPVPKQFVLISVHY